MTETILVLAIAAGLACPVHMWWQHRRGRSAACCPPQRGSADAGLDAEGLRTRHTQLSARIAEMECTASSGPLGRP